MSGLRGMGVGGNESESDPFEARFGGGNAEHIDFDAEVTPTKHGHRLPDTLTLHQLQEEAAECAALCDAGKSLAVARGKLNPDGAPRDPEKLAKEAFTAMEAEQYKFWEEGHNPKPIDFEKDRISFTGSEHAFNKLKIEATALDRIYRVSNKSVPGNVMFFRKFRSAAMPLLAAQGKVIAQINHLTQGGRVDPRFNTEYVVAKGIRASLAYRMQMIMEEVNKVTKSVDRSMVTLQARVNATAPVGSNAAKVNVPKKVQAEEFGLTYDGTPKDWARRAGLGRQVGFNQDFLKGVAIEGLGAETRAKEAMQGANVRASGVMAYDPAYGQPAPAKKARTGPTAARPAEVPIQPAFILAINAEGITQLVDANGQPRVNEKGEPVFQ